jgi:hypothetical protein
MQIESKVLLQELELLCGQATAAAQSFKALTDNQLNFKTDTERWSILECMEHLNLYGDYYLPEIEQQISLSKTDSAAIFQSGLLGNYFALSMRAKNRKVQKMKSPKDKVPVQSDLGRQTIERFLMQQEQLKSLLRASYNKDLNTIRISISLNRYIRIKLGDTFRFYSYHIERHLVQAKRNLM